MAQPGVRVQSARIVEKAADDDGVSFLDDRRRQENHAEPGRHVADRQRNAGDARIAVLVGDDRRNGVGSIAWPIVEIPVAGCEAARDLVHAHGVGISVALINLHLVRVQQTWVGD